MYIYLCGDRGLGHWIDVMKQVRSLTNAKSKTATVMAWTNEIGPTVDAARIGR